MSAATVIHGPSCHLRGPSLLPFPVGSVSSGLKGAELVSKSGICSSSSPNGSTADSLITQVSPQFSLPLRDFFLSSPIPVINIFCCISLFTPYSACQKWISSDFFTSLFSVFHMTLVTWGQTLVWLPVGAVTSLSDPKKHPAQVGCSSKENQLLPISDRPEAEDPMTIMVSVKWWVWTWWFPSAKILWLIIITCEHPLQKDLVEELFQLLKKPHLNWVAFCLFMPVAGVREKYRRVFTSLG